MSNVQDGIRFWAVEDNVEKLKRLYAEGKTHGQIAKEFGGAVSRNAIIGKVARLGLKRSDAHAIAETARLTAKRQAATAREEKKALALKIASSTAPTQPVAPTPPKEPPRPPKALMLTLVELGARQCKWPIGDDRPQRFCGMAQAVEGKPYCAFHAREALPKERRDAPPRKAGDLARQLRRFV